ncbi:MAG: O-antigen ligase family protein [Deltaproteobacteria bacterium]
MGSFLSGLAAGLRVLPKASCGLPKASCGLPKASCRLPKASCGLPKASLSGQASTVLLVLFIVVAALFGLNIGRLGSFAADYFFYIFLAFVMFVLAFMRTDFALAVLIVSMLLSPEIDLGSISDRAITIRLDDILLIVIFMGWLAKLAVFKELGVLKRTALNGPILVYAFVCVVSTAIMLIGGEGSILRSFFYFLKYFEYFLLYFLVVNNINEMRQVRSFLLLIFFTCFLVSCYALYSYFVMGMRATAPFEGEGGEANTLAGYLILMLALVISLLMHNGLPRYKTRLQVLLAVAGLALLFTLSRGGWLGFIVMCVALVHFARRNRLILVFCLVALTVAAPLIAPASVRKRVRATFASGQTYKVAGREVTIDKSGAARIESWKVGWRKVLERPVLGHGIPGGSVVDNQYTRVMIEVGLLGLWAFLFLLRRIYLMARHTSRQVAHHPFAYSIAAGFLAGYFGILIHAFSAASFIIIRIMEPFWFIFAMVVVLPDIVGVAGAAPAMELEGT